VGHIISVVGMGLYVTESLYPSKPVLPGHAEEEKPVKDQKMKEQK
jgi:hypothetical protein